MAVNLAKADRKVVEAAEQTIREYPDEVNELVTTISGRSLVEWAEMSASQRKTFVGATIQAVGTTMLATVTTPNARTMILTILVAIVVFGIAVSSLESEVKDTRSPNATDE
ncbi:hypothetical protein [Corynebacterium cystitidis]|uniref:hypothetical protein n=1 Tax=Corynebacterium cystitidis TaxID=35757 RepID=UPI00211E5CB1|nr:hypothetical protein [Corynebacterium cystitidis]